MKKWMEGVRATLMMSSQTILPAPEEVEIVKSEVDATNDRNRSPLHSESEETVESDEEPKQEDQQPADEEPKQEDQQPADEEPKQEDQQPADEEPKQEDQQPADEEPKQEDQQPAEDQPAPIETKQETEQETVKNEEIEKDIKEVINNGKSYKKMKKNYFGGSHTATHAFGIESPLFSLDKNYNQMCVQHRVVNSEANELNKDLNAFGSSLMERVQALSNNGLMGALEYGKMIKNESAINYDFSNLENLGAEYVVRRQDLLIAYIKQLPSVHNLFPVRSGVQNKEAAPSVAFGGLSQGYRDADVFKGSVTFGADLYRVAAVMCQLKLTNLPELEKQYVGYLNTDGSEVIKWNFIEWIVAHFAEVLSKEQAERNVQGVELPQQDVIANPANHAADGIIRAIERTVRDHRVRPLESKTGKYTPETILEYVEALWDEFTSVVPSTVGYKIYINARHKNWYSRAYHAKYGKDTNFAGAITELEPEAIIWVPNMAKNSYQIFIAEQGNIILLEDKPGEMFNFKFAPELRGVGLISRWKEGAHVQKAGVKFETAEELEADNYASQFIFVNDPSAEATADAAEIDLKDNRNLLIKVGDATEVEIPDTLDIDANGTATVRFDKKVTVKVGTKTFTNTDEVILVAELEDKTVTVGNSTYKVTRPTGKVIGYVQE